MLKTEDPAHPPHLNPIAKLALELGPLGLFFFANQRWDIMTATAAFTVATVVALAIHYALVKRLPMMPLVSGVVVVVFGGLTLILADELFIKLKPTIVNSLFGAVLLGGLFFASRCSPSCSIRCSGSPTRAAQADLPLGAVLLLPRASTRWSGARRHDFWVSFKVFGIMPITLVFALAQTPLIMRHEDKSGTQAPEG